MDPNAITIGIIYINKPCIACLNDNPLHTKNPINNGKSKKTK